MSNIKLKRTNHIKGKLVVIEGGDGSGKATQLRLLKEYLEKQKVSVQVVDFPQYETSIYGKMIAAYLRGEYGKLDQIHPQLISAIYAMDRVQAKERMDKWLSEGSIILANRYANSNMAHQSARFADDKKEEFLSWVHELEYEVNKIPREDLVIYLHVPYKIAQELILKKDANQRLYAKGKKRDMVEENTEYLRKSEEAYLSLVEKYPHWEKISSVDSQGKLRSKEEIHIDIRRLLFDKGVLSS